MVWYSRLYYVHEQCDFVVTCLLFSAGCRSYSNKSFAKCNKLSAFLKHKYNKVDHSLRSAAITLFEEHDVSGPSVANYLK